MEPLRKPFSGEALFKCSPGLSPKFSNPAIVCVYPEGRQITTESKVINSFINAQSVFDRNDLLKPTTFNTKGSPCGASLNEYLVGSRNINVLNISQVSEREQTKNNYCRFNTFNKYHFKESITFEMKSNTTDQTIGIFTGIGEDAEFVDYKHPVEYGEEYYCGRPGEN